MNKFRFWFAIMLLSIITMGCLSSLVPAPAPTGPGTNTNGAVKSLLTTMNWLTAFCVLGIGLSVFALANGNKLGLAGIAASGATLVACLTVARYAIWIAWLGLVVSVVGAASICIYTIFIKNRALKEIVNNIEKFKEDGQTLVFKDALKTYLNEQSNSTKTIVKKVKEKT